eukprot:2775975-Alexandrium_andersonii.AAC.1
MLIHHSQPLVPPWVSCVGGGRSSLPHAQPAPRRRHHPLSPRPSALRHHGARPMGVGELLPH